MYKICKTHTNSLNLIKFYNKLRLIRVDVRNSCHYLNAKSKLNSIYSQNSTFISRYFSIKAKEENNNLLEQQINQLNNSNSLVLFCPKWKSMYEVFYSGKCLHNIEQQIDTNLGNNFSNNSNNSNNSSINLFNTSEEWKRVEPLNASSVFKYYSQLAKLRLTGLVVLTTLAGYYMGLQSPIDVSILTATLLGTALTSGSATALNQYLEIPFDSQMKRTRNRPLVVGHISPLHSVGFATVTGITGLTLLSYVNPLTAILGASNLLLYSFIYTPMKRAHIANTWVGAVVGAIPPVMGFTAANNCIDMSALLVGLMLYSWQFPHFNALSWNMRHDYARAGYRMMSVTEPKLCLDTALRHSCFILMYSTLMCTCLTTWTFGIDSLPFNLYLIYLSWKFRSDPSAKSSRKLFLYSLIHLPAIIMLMLISKRRTNQSNNTNDNTNDNTNTFQLSQIKDNNELSKS